MVGHAWEKIAEADYESTLQHVIKIIATDYDWIEYYPTEKGMPFFMLLEGSDDDWVGIDIDFVCSRCGAYMLGDSGGDYLAVVGGDDSCTD